MNGLCVLGATGSIGLSTLDVVARHPQRFPVVALTANCDVEGMARLCAVHRPRYAVMVDPAAAARLRVIVQDSRLAVEVLSGEQSLVEVAALDEVDSVMAAIVGAAGLLPTLAAVRAGKRVLLANKEALVMTGRLFMDEVERSGAVLLPIDSEHNAIYQCMPRDFSSGLEDAGVRRVLLTASGGPFRDRPLESLHAVTPQEACAHPNWSMGRKISVDSATMMNKGLEFIEACWLFHTTPDKIDVVVHHQSVVHSLVDYVDGSMLAQLGNPDMRTPIAHALAWPDRVDSGVQSLDLVALARLDFAPPDSRRFPCLGLARAAMTAGGTAPTILNAANEVAVNAFLESQLRFTDISAVIDHCMGKLPVYPADDLENILSVDREARAVARAAVRGMTEVSVQ